MGNFERDDLVKLKAMASELDRLVHALRRSCRYSFKDRQDPRKPRFARAGFGLATAFILAALCCSVQPVEFSMWTAQEELPLLLLRWNMFDHEIPPLLLGMEGTSS